MKTLSHILNGLRFMVGLFCGLSMLGHALLLAQILFTVPENWWIHSMVHAIMLLIFGFVANMCLKPTKENKEEIAQKTVDAEA